METLISKAQTRYPLFMPRVYEVKSPCQWLKNCNDGKCPSLIKLNGNFYCAHPKQIHS